MIIKKEENEIIGSWNFDGRTMIKDENCKRINLLITKHLKKIATDQSGWCTLYKNPNDDRFWELVYLQGEMHGDGPPSLVNISSEKAGICVGYITLHAQHPPPKAQWSRINITGNKFNHDFH